MAILKKSQAERHKRQIDLTGPEGNAWVLMAYARQWARDLGRDPKPITQEMMSGDYENLLKVFDREFGCICDLLR